MRLLLHTCCSNCALHPIKSLEQEGFEITLFWFNPNIQPYTEYKERLESLKRLQSLWNLEIYYDEDYRKFYKFIRLVCGKEMDRCSICYRLRLEETAKKALELGLEYFTTTLLISPYQKFDKIIKIGRELEKEYGVSFIERDFRDGFREAMSLASKMDFYRQKYCGCIYSEAERYLKVIDYE